MKLTLRPYQAKEGYWCVREFLREVSLHTPALHACRGHHRDFSWSLLRWEWY